MFSVMTDGCGPLATLQIRNSGGVIMLWRASPRMTGELTDCVCSLAKEVAAVEALNDSIPVIGVICLGVACKVEECKHHAVKYSNHILPNGHTYVIFPKYLTYDSSVMILEESEFGPLLRRVVDASIAAIDIHHRAMLRCMYLAYMHEKKAMDRNKLRVFCIVGFHVGSYGSEVMLEELAKHHALSESGEPKPGTAAMNKFLDHMMMRHDEPW